MKPSAPISKKPNNYYSQVRLDLIALIKNQRFTNILEIGCGQGLTLKYLQDHNLAQTTYGIELDPHQSQIARTNIDHIFNINVENTTLPKVKFDLILLPDILEHLHDPAKLLTQLHSSLAPNGTVLISVPNIQHISVLRQLLRGRWDYADSGIMDRTHLHFFTQKTILEMLNQTGYKILDIQHNGGYLPHWKSILNFLTGNRLRPWFVPQWLIKTKI